MLCPRRRTRAQMRPVHRIRLRQRRDRQRVHTHGQSVRQENRLSRVRGRATGGVRRERVSVQQRRLLADLYRLAAHIPLRLQTRIQVDQQQHV